MSKFKTKEELLGKMKRHRIYELGLNDSFSSFKERIDFYKKYRWIGEEQFKKEYTVIYQECYLYEKNAFLRWDVWLFNYCFGDIE